MAIIFVALFAAMVLFGEKQYRYKCQNPDYYQLPECQPPLCEVSGNCTRYLIGEVGTIPATLPREDVK